MRAGLDLFSCIESYDRKYKIYVKKRFKIKNSVTERTVKVAESFGIGIDDEQEFVVFDNFVIGFSPKDIVYVTGDSGSGKSQLLFEVMRNVSEETYIFDKNITIADDEVLIDNVGKDLNEAIKILSVVGLNDAFLFLRQYSQLSDGQKLRYRLAKMIDSDREIFIFDEFCASLDRETAKIIAFNMQKYCRAHDKILIVATTHIDLRDDLCPSIYVYKSFSDDFVIEYSDVIRSDCSIICDIQIVESDSLKQIESLEKFHYRGDVESYKRIILLYMNKNIIGFMTISYPLLQLKGRNKYLEGKFNISSTDNCTLLNKEVECISRIVIHPKYRGIGLAHRFVKHYLTAMSHARYIETVAVMAKYNPFFEKAGMTLIEVDNSDEKYDTLLVKLSELGFSLNMIRSTNYVKQVYESFDTEKKNLFDDVCKELFKRYSGVFGGGYRHETNTRLFEDRNFIKLFHRMLKSDVKYLIYDNTEKYMMLQRENKQTIIEVNQDEN
jgi:ABC-type lipoprotein export system ATPase subunit